MPDKRSEPTLHSTRVNGVEIAWAEWGSAELPALFLAHATGFHGRCWDQVAQYFSGYRVIALDHRGHGRSTSKSPFTWEQFGNDITEFILALGLRDIAAVGHSMGGHTLVQAAARLPDRFSRLVLIDPVIASPGDYDQEQPQTFAKDGVAKRRSKWDSARQMAEKLSSRIPFTRWQPEVLADYCEYGLVRDGGDYQLACAPEIEATIYAGALDLNIYDYVSRITAPVTIVRARTSGPEAAMQDFSASPTWPDLASKFALGRDIYRPEQTHFMPMEDPELVASIIQQAIDQRP